MDRQCMYIGGMWREARSGRWFDVVNPSTLETIAQVPDGGGEDAAEAVAAAQQAFEEWSKTTAYERSQLLRRWYELMTEHRGDLARTMTLEQGKPLAEAGGEVDYAASFIGWYAEEAKRIYGEVIPASSRDKRLFVIKQPVGVVAAVTPWNFPAAMITRKAGPALAAGCTFVVKPAEDTPLTALRLAELAEEAGIPAGVFNVVTGLNAEAIGEALLSDERVRKVTFTGSTEVGKTIMRQAADTVKKVALELGGNAPAIVFADADLEKTAEQIMHAKYRNAGETCIAINRIYAEQSIHADLVRMLSAKSKALKVGDGLEADVQIGPLINRKGLEKIERHLRDAAEKGARIVCGGERLRLPGRGGYFFQPTVVEHVQEDMLLMRQETFGPVIPIASFADRDEALRKANATKYGLAAYLFTSDVSRAVRAAERLEYGIIGLNDGGPSAAQAPFGGVKESGFGREGGRQGIEDYLEVKYISLGLF